METFFDLFRQGTRGGSDKWLSYLEVYERYLARFRGTAARSLEIGVQKGGSLELMKRYLGDQAKVFGIDIDPACAAVADQGFAEKIFIGDAANGGFLTEVGRAIAPLDIIIDDGGHQPSQQITSFLTLFAHLKDGGVYIIEDLHTAFWPSHQHAPLGITFYDYARGLIDKLSLRHMDPRHNTGRFATPPDQRGAPLRTGNPVAEMIFSIAFYDSICVIEKRQVPEPVRVQSPAKG